MLINGDITNAKFQKKFTLIELLVCISIISILMSLMMPSIAKARLKTKGSVCINNLKQIGIAYSLYADGHNGHLNSQRGWHKYLGANPRKPNDLAKDRLLNLYVDTRKIAECPSDMGDALHNKSSCYKSYGTSYMSAYSRRVFGIEWLITRNGQETRSINHFSDTTRKILIGDFPLHRNRSWNDMRSRWHDWGERRKINILWLDMHATPHTFPLEFNTISGGADADPDRWGFY